jgi:hypothetical protein
MYVYNPLLICSHVPHSLSLCPYALLMYIMRTVYQIRAIYPYYDIDRTDGKYPYQNDDRGV